MVYAFVSITSLLSFNITRFNKISIAHLSALTFSNIYPNNRFDSDYVTKEYNKAHPLLYTKISFQIAHDSMYSHIVLPNPTNLTSQRNFLQQPRYLTRAAQFAHYPNPSNILHYESN